MKFNRKSLLKLSAVLEKLYKEYGLFEFSGALKIICKIHWLIDQGCEIVEDWIMAQSDLTNKVAVPWNLSVHPESANRIIPCENYKSGTYFILIPKELAEKILLFGIPEVETSQMTEICKWWRGEKTFVETSQMTEICKWWRGEKTFDQLQNEMKTTTNN